MRVLKSSNLFFIISYVVWLVYEILSLSFYARYFSKHTGRFVFIFCCVLATVGLLFKRNFSYKFFIYLLSSFALCILLRYFGMPSLSIAVLYVLCARDVIDFRKIAHISIVVIAIISLFVIVSCKMSIIPNYIFYRGDCIRECCGFLYPLVLPGLFFCVVALFVYIKKDGLRFYELLVILFINYYLYLKANARLNFYLSLCLILIAYLMKFKKKWLEMFVIKYIFVFSYIICFIVSVYFTIYYQQSNMWMRALNDWMGGRLYLQYSAFLNYGFSLFGKKIRFIGNGLDMYGNLAAELYEYNYVDNIYIKMCLSAGIIFIILFIILFTLLIWKFYKIKDYYLVLILCFFAGHGLIDDLILFLSCNIFLLLPVAFKFKDNQLISDNKLTLKDSAICIKEIKV